MGGFIGSLMSADWSKMASSIGQSMDWLTPKIDGFTKALKAPSLVLGNIKQKLKNTTAGFGRLNKVLSTGGAIFKALKAVGSKVGSGLMTAGGAIFGFIEQLGVLDPIIEVIGALLEIFGGVLLEQLMPSFQKLFDILLSPTVMELITMLAGLFAKLMIPLIDLVIMILPPLVELIKMLIPPMEFLIEIFVNFVTLIANNVVPIIKFLGDVFVGMFEGVVFVAKVVYNVFAFIWNFVAGIINFLFGWIGFTIPALPIMTLQTGGITKNIIPAILHPNEAIIPLDNPEATEMLGGGSEEMLDRQDITNELLVELINMKKRKQLGSR